METIIPTDNENIYVYAVCCNNIIMYFTDINVVTQYIRRYILYKTPQYNFHKQMLRGTDDILYTTAKENDKFYTDLWDKFGLAA